MSEKTQIKFYSICLECLQELEAVCRNDIPIYDIIYVLTLIHSFVCIHLFLMDALFSCLQHRQID